jgi:hypothetical protein
MVVAGASLTAIQQQKGFAAPQTKKQEQNTIQSLRGNFEKRGSSQHIDQENQCLRAGKLTDLFKSPVQHVFVDFTTVQYILKNTKLYKLIRIV